MLLVRAKTHKLIRHRIPTDCCVVLGRFCTTNNVALCWCRVHISSLPVSQIPVLTFGYPCTPRPWWRMEGIEVTCLTCVTFQGGLWHNVDRQTCTKILTEHAAGMDNMIHRNAGTYLPGFTASHHTRLYLALTPMKTSDLATVFTEVKYQRFTCDYIVDEFTVLKIKVVAQYSIKPKHRLTLCCVQTAIFWWSYILVGGKSK